MNDAALISIGAVTAAVVGGVIEGIRRVSNAAETRTVRLGQNLGPRVEELAKGDPRIEVIQKELAELRGSVKVLLARETRARRKTLAGVPAKVEE